LLEQNDEWAVQRGRYMTSVARGGAGSTGEQMRGLKTRHSRPLCRMASPVREEAPA
jgi:hypothetical protein